MNASRTYSGGPILKQTGSTVTTTPKKRVRIVDYNENPKNGPVTVAKPVVKAPSLSKLIVKEIGKIKYDVLPLATTIYKNFEYISESPELMHNIDEIKKLLTSGDMKGFLVFDGTKMVAYLIGEFKQLPDGRSSYYITYIFVGANYRYKKIGSKMLALLQTKCVNEWGIKFITLTVDTNDTGLTNYYRRRGFSEDPMLKNGGRHEVLTLYL